MERLGTFEEWYQWEMKQRDNKRSWHYPTVLNFEIVKKRKKDSRGNLAVVEKYERAVYRTL